MGLSREEKKLFADITATLNQMKQPSAAQQFLDNQAMEAANWVSRGDYRTRPNNAFFSIEDPTIANQQRKVMLDSVGDGVSALANGTADSTALALNKDYLNDKWARDSAANYQDQVSDFANRATGALGGSANAEAQRQSNLLSGQLSAMQVAPKKTSLFSSLIKGGISLAGNYLAGGGAL